MNTRSVLFMIIIVFLLAGCGSVTPATPKPEADTITGMMPVPDAFSHYRNDYARSRVFDEAIGKIRRISIKYRLSAQSEYTRQEVASSHWNREIEKGLIRMGFIIVNDVKKDPLLVPGEQGDDEMSDASLVIDSVCIKKIPSRIKATHGEIPSFTRDYPYNYFISEINGSLVLRNRDVVWSGSIHATSFDMLRPERGLKKPAVQIHASRNYRFSDKLNRWVHGQWEITLNDNFSGFYDTPLEEEYISRALIRFTVSQLFSSLGN